LVFFKKAPDFVATVVPRKSTPVPPLSTRVEKLLGHPLRVTNLHLSNQGFKGACRRFLQTACLPASCRKVIEYRSASVGKTPGASPQVFSPLPSSRPPRSTIPFSPLPLPLFHIILSSFPPLPPPPPLPFLLSLFFFLFFPKNKPKKKTKKTYNTPPQPDPTHPTTHHPPPTPTSPPHNHPSPPPPPTPKTQHHSPPPPPPPRFSAARAECCGKHFGYEGKKLRF